MIRRELARFLLVGSLTVLLDFLVYSGLLSWHVLATDPAKGLSFITGTLFAYVANRFWTFDNRQPAPGSAPRFILVYGATLMTNVAINAVMLTLLRGPLEFISLANQHAVGLAFLVATTVSATLNFVGMRTWVFREARTSSTKPPTGP